MINPIINVQFDYNSKGDIIIKGGDEIGLSTWKLA